jgi:hypothetical protein
MLIGFESLCVAIAANHIDSANALFISHCDVLPSLPLVVLEVRVARQIRERPAGIHIRVRAQQGGKIMSSRSARKPHAAPPEKVGAAPNAGVQSAIRVEAAANEDKPTSGFSSDPLFGMAIATGILFAVLAALMALS